MQGSEFAYGRKSLLAVLVVCWSKLSLLHRVTPKYLKELTSSIVSLLKENANFLVIFSFCLPPEFQTGR